MAKKVTIVFKNPVDETNMDHMEVWWKLGAGGTYAQLGTDIAFITGTADYSVEDTSANVADSANLYYEARAYNATGDYNSLEANITISAAVANNYIEFLEAQTDNIVIPISLVNGTDWYMEVKLRTSGSTIDSYWFGNAGTAPQLTLGRKASDNTWQWRLEGSSQSAKGVFNANTWYKFRLEYRGSDDKYRVLIDDVVLFDYAAAITLTTGGNNFNVGKHHSGVDGDWDIDYIDLDGELYNFNEIFAGTPPTVKDSTALISRDVTTDRADEQLMVKAV